MSTLLGIYVEHPFWAWAALGALLLAIEAGAGSGWLLWPAAAAVVVGVIALLFPGLSAPVEVLIFAILVIVSILLSRRYLPRSVIAHGGDINDNVSRLIAREGVAVTGFVRGRGRVSIDGKEWPAEVEGEGVKVSAGDKVTVTEVEGLELRVKLC